ncbi:ATP-binding cassette domain-containing protein [Rhizobium vallis]|uniref:ATP-binding cassette domain-containing protein n=1 Tax=Rhizobium vallis TaxID=634290 RepID=A0A432PD84_9HYPH|nr:ATP-binding cassette domain-containing protein [Rhizobium vallis]RUM20452.1 ATP-binding cassette domain-containing protein [Rhizobium vallis]
MVTMMPKLMSNGGYTAVLGASVLALVPFLVGPFQVELVALALLYGLFAFGLDVAWGRAGIVTIGQAIFFGCGAYGIGLAAKSDIWAGWGVLGALAVSCIVAAAIGGAGLRRASSPSTMAVLTLAMALLAEKIAITWVGVTGGSNGLFVAPPSDANLYYWSALALITLVVLATKMCVFDRRLGNRLTAIRLNEQQAEHLGIGTHSTRVVAFVIGAAIATLAGAMAAPLITTVTPDRVGILLSTQALVWVALGGRGTLVGPFAGALVAVYGQDALAGSVGDYYLLILGVLFVLSVLFMPRGIVGLFEKGEYVAPIKPPDFRKPRLAQDTATTDICLETRDLVVCMGGSAIINKLDLSIRSSEIVCIIGPNGAGKSTMLNAISGQLPSSNGTILLRGSYVTGTSSSTRARVGLSRTFQVPSLFPELTVGDHMALARQEGSACDVQPERYRRLEQMRGDVPVGKLSLGERRMLEISMALARRPDLLLLDEPAAGLARNESELLVEDLKELRQGTGCAIVCVEHDMELVRKLADRVICLHQGRILKEGTMDQVSADPDVRRSYLGQR